MDVHRVTDLEGKKSSSNLQDEAPTPLPVVGLLFISSLLFHLSRVLLGAWRFGLFRRVRSVKHFYFYALSKAHRGVLVPTSL